MSMEKKAECRFNIILNPGDPMHKTAIHALNNQGRHKSQFIVNAIIHYIRNDADVKKSIGPDTEEIRLICRDVLSEMIDRIPGQTNPCVSDEIPDTDAVDSDIDFSAIADTLNGFRKK